jgi:phosphoribosylanthranilate isomerase
MSLIRCTFTGLDEKFSLEDFSILSSRYSFLEWGILYSTSENSNISSNRYPSQKWFEHHIEEINNIAKKTGVSLALHVCGKESLNLIEQNNPFLEFLLPYFNRVQINFRYKSKQKEQLISLFENHPDINFITQQNLVNKELITDIPDVDNHHLLFDSSGGRGVMEKSWTAPIGSKLCGYAGGLGPDNIGLEIDNIDLTAGFNDYWIDMETKIRTNEWLDSQKCQNVAKVVGNFLKSQ